MDRNTQKGSPTKEDKKGGKPLAREPTRGRRKTLEAINDSACATLKAVDNIGMFDDGKEKVEAEHAPGGRPPLAAFWNVRAYTPGVHETPFVSRRGGRNQRWNLKSREEVSVFNEDEELPEQDAGDSVVTNALRRINVLVFHSRGPPCPDDGTDSACRGCHLPHKQSVVLYGHYHHRNTPGKSWASK